MTDKKFKTITITDNEYVRILKYCNTIKTEQHCNTCPLYEYENCTVFLLDGAAGLIKWKNSEISRLEAALHECHKHEAIDYMR